MLHPDPPRAGSAERPTGIATGALETPQLVVDVDRLDGNIRRMAEAVAAAGVDLRPHAKTHKLIEVARRQLAAGARGLTVAKLGEAEVFAAHGIDDLFVAYPLWGPVKWERLCALAERIRIRVAADSFAVVEGIAAAAARRGLTIPVRIEVDTGFGRCGVQGPEEARALAERIAPLRGVRVVGVMSFAGRAYAADAEAVRAAAIEDAERAVAAAEAIRAAGMEATEVSVGSTPAARHVAALPGITEIRPGTYVFSDRDQAALGWGTLADCALTAVVTVVSRPTSTRAVIDAGTKTLTSDRAHLVEGWGAVVGEPAWRIVSLSEEHGVLEVPPRAGPAIGQTLEIVPNHACGALNLHDWVAVARDGVVEDWWRVEARGRIR
jgi:D-serine deaminase-like pyridoxal phosphate-dependent protein